MRGQILDLMKKRFFISSVFFLFTIKLFAQEISDSDFSKLVSNKSILYFDNANKKYFGCGMNLDCMEIQMFFKTVYFNKGDKKLRISGYVNPTTTNTGDTIGANIFKIFIARPVKGKLKNVRMLAEVEDTVKSKIVTTTINSNEFSFTTDFKFSKGDCLYIESGELFRLKEYCISSLLSPK